MGHAAAARGDHHPETALEPAAPAGGRPVTPERSGLRPVLLALAALVILLGGTAVFAWRVAEGMGEVAVGIHPFIAIGSGVVAMILLAIGLLRLTHVSNVRSQKEAAEEEAPDRDGRTRAEATPRAGDRTAR